MAHKFLSSVEINSVIGPEFLSENFNNYSDYSDFMEMNWKYFFVFAIVAVAFIVAIIVCIIKCRLKKESSHDDTIISSSTLRDEPFADRSGKFIRDRPYHVVVIDE